MKTKLLPVLSALGLLASAVGGLGSGGCGGVSVSSICDEICACQNCTTKDRADCEDSGNQARQKADSVGCGSEFDDLLGCAKDNAHCVGDHASFDACTAEAKAIEVCTAGGGNPLLDPCQIASDHLGTCLDVTSSGSSGGAVTCSGANACSAACINAASCAEIKDAFGGMSTELSKPFIDCVTKCSSAGGGSGSSSSGG